MMTGSRNIILLTAKVRDGQVVDDDAEADADGYVDDADADVDVDVDDDDDEPFYDLFFLNPVNCLSICGLVSATCAEGGSCVYRELMIIPRILSV